MSSNRRTPRFLFSSGMALLAPLVVVLIVTFSFSITVSAQTNIQPLAPIAVQGAQLIADAPAYTTAALSSLSPAPDTTGPVIERSRGSGSALLDLPRTLGTRMVEAADPLAAQQLAANEHQQRVFSSKIVNVDGQGFSGINPSSNVGDVGLTEYVQLVNDPNGSRVAIYNKFTGALIGGPITLADLAPAGSNCRLNAVGDPMVLFDPYAQRWVMSEVADSPAALCVYVSQTSSLIGAYYAYQFTTPGFPDSPKLSVWHDAYYVTASEALSPLANAPVIYALERSDMLIGEAAKALRVSATPLDGFDVQSLTPADADGIAAPPVTEPAAFLRHVDDELHEPSPVFQEDRLELWQYKPNFANPTASVLMGPTHIKVVDFDSEFCSNFFACIPQPATSTLLDPLLETVMWRVQYRNFGTYQTLVGSYTVGDLDSEAADRAAVRWFEMRNSGTGWGIHQQGTFTTNDTLSRWVSTIGMDRFGNIALGYNASNATLIFPSVYYTGRKAGDAAGIMTQGNILVQSGNSSLATSTWGEYNSLNIDPVDDCTFYYTGNYTKGGQWATRISSFRFDDCIGAVAPTPTPSPTVPAPSPTPPVAPEEVVLIANGGFEAVGDGSTALSWSLSNGDKDKVKCNKTVEGKVYSHTGDCAFQFKGIDGEASKLKQTFEGSETQFIEGDVIDFNFYVNAPKSILDMKAKMKVSYDDPNAPTGKNTITLSPTSGDYVFKTTSYTLINDFVSKIQVSFDHRTPGGKLYLDDVNLNWKLIAARRTRGERPTVELVPLP